MRRESQRRFRVCVDSYEDDGMRGRLVTPLDGESKDFTSLTQLLLKMEEHLNQLKFPQAFDTLRRFSSGDYGYLPDRDAETEAVERDGELATFEIRILFRQNASWQGSVYWSEGQYEEGFRSVLELIFLMHSALTADGADAAIS